jgi:molybdopterin-guanine dinucleotide biosynthesis protein A
LGPGLTNAPAGAILAGGRGTRLGGTDKGLLEVGGRRMIDRVSDALLPLVPELILVSNAPEAGQWLPGARLVRDILTGGGSAAGVHAALVAAARPVVVLAWDLPFIDVRAVAELLRDFDETSVDAVVPAGAVGGSFEPLCGVYTPACADAIARAWATGDRSLHSVLGRVRTRVVATERFAPWGGAERLFLNVNTADDLENARRMAGA